MYPDKQFDAIFSILLEVKWLMKERFRDGLKALLKEAVVPQEMEAVQHVLRKMTYCQSDDLVLAGNQAATQIESVWGLNPENTLIVGVAQPGKTCGSTAYLRCIETSLPRTWSNAKSIWTTIDSAFQMRQSHSNLVIVDDFIGTGEKLGALLGRLRANPKTLDYAVHVCSFATMKIGMDKVSPIVGGRFIANLVLQKSISDLLVEPKRSLLLAAMLDLEKKLYPKPGDYTLGYKQSEASFYLEGYNIPNNNFPILWRDQYVDKTPRRTLFARR